MGQFVFTRLVIIYYIVYLFWTILFYWSQLSDFYSELFYFTVHKFLTSILTLFHFYFAFHKLYLLCKGEEEWGKFLLSGQIVPSYIKIFYKIRYLMLNVQFEPKFFSLYYKIYMYENQSLCVCSLYKCTIFHRFDKTRHA